METRIRLCFSAKAAICGPRMTVPSSFISSASTPTGGKPGEPAKIDAGFRMARAHQDATFFGHQRKHMARTHEVTGAHIAVGQSPHCIGALFRGNAGRQTVTGIDRNREGGAQRGVVTRNHRIEMQPPRLVLGQRSADDAGGMADDERHLFRRA